MQDKYEKFWNKVNIYDIFSNYIKFVKVQDEVFVGECIDKFDNKLLLKIDNSSNTLYINSTKAHYLEIVDLIDYLENGGVKSVAYEIAFKVCGIDINKM